MNHLEASNCVYFTTLQRAIELPNVPSLYIREKTHAIDLCTKHCGQVKKSCAEIIHAEMEEREAA